MAQMAIVFSAENTKYINSMIRITGLSASVLVNRAIDARRDSDKDLMNEFDALLQKFDIPTAPTRKLPVRRKVISPDEYANMVAAEVCDAEEQASDLLLDDFNDDDDFRVEVGKMKKYATR